jgi:WD40 repeat protein
MLASWDTESGTRIRRHPGHEEVINSMDVSKRGEEILVSGSDDGYIGVGLESSRVLEIMLIRLALGYAPKSRNRFHRDRLSGHSSCAVRSRKRTLLWRNRQRHKGVGYKKKSGDILINRPQ